MANPNYCTEPKAWTRDQLMIVYRKYTKKQSLPRGKQYWTLCNRQPNDERSEICQLIKEGFLKKHQFYGVDNDAEIITANRAVHPEAHWFCGDWLEVLGENYKSFNPGLVNYDSTGMVNNLKNLICLAKTMARCPRRTMVVANMLLSTGRDRRRASPDNIAKVFQLGFIHKAKWEELPHYIPTTTHQAEMAMFFFVRVE